MEKLSVLAGYDLYSKCSGERTFSWNLTHLALATSGTPSKRSPSGPKMGPLAQACLPQDDSTGCPQLGHHAGIPRYDWAKQCKWASRGVQLVFCCNIILEQNWDTMQPRLWSWHLRLPVIVSLISLVQGIWVHLYDPFKDWVESANLSKIELNQLPWSELVLLESQLEIMHGGFFDREVVAHCDVAWAPRWYFKQKNQGQGREQREAHWWTGSHWSTWTLLWKRLEDSLCMPMKQHMHIAVG